MCNTTGVQRRRHSAPGPSGSRSIRSPVSTVGRLRRGDLGRGVQTVPAGRPRSARARSARAARPGRPDPPASSGLQVDARCARRPPATSPAPAPDRSSCRQVHRAPPADRTAVELVAVAVGVEAQAGRRCPPPPGASGPSISASAGEQGGAAGRLVGLGGPGAASCSRSRSASPGTRACSSAPSRRCAGEEGRSAPNSSVGLPLARRAGSPGIAGCRGRRPPRPPAPRTRAARRRLLDERPVALRDPPPASSILRSVPAILLRSGVSHAVGRRVLTGPAPAPDRARGLAGRAQRRRGAPAVPGRRRASCTCRPPTQVHLPAERLYPRPARPGAARRRPGAADRPGALRARACPRTRRACCSRTSTARCRRRAVVAVVPYRPPSPLVLPAPDDALGRAVALLHLAAGAPGGRRGRRPGRRGGARPRPRALPRQQPAAADRPRWTRRPSSAAAEEVGGNAGWPHRAAAAALAGRRPTSRPSSAGAGWEVEELLLMARSGRVPAPDGDRAEVVAQREVHEFWDRSWRRDLADVRDRSTRVVAQLVGREHLNDRVVAVTDLVVREEGRVVAVRPAPGRRRDGRRRLGADRPGAPRARARRRAPGPGAGPRRGGRLRPRRPGGGGRRLAAALVRPPRLRRRSARAWSPTRAAVRPRRATSTRAAGRRPRPRAAASRAGPSARRGRAAGCPCP